ncbi:MAG: hypothetical protein DMF56_05800 [Acidobacteria bacterium]|nr:MAG: hypothetical protein DMF56_05800 [Acidobacteriota bacterium]
MTQIVFLTLFLGLTMGRQPVAVSVTGAPAARVEITLDGQPVANIAREPWKASVDFGDHLLPRRLVARALDANGNELARVEQRVNLPRRVSEASLVMEGSSARLVWQSLETEKPKDIHWMLDGARISFASTRVSLPAYDPEKPHLLRAVATSASGLIAEAELVFGGGLADSAGASLTPIPVRIEKSEAEIKNAITVNGEPAQIVAIEKLPADIIFVREPSLANFAFRVDVESRVHGREGFNVVGGAAVPLERQQGTRFMWPVAIRMKGTSEADLFASSRTFMVGDAPGVRNVLGRVSAPPSENLRFADAVAVAGLQAAGSRRPRAVVLITGAKYRDWSQLPPKKAKEYLASIGVPLYVWTVGDATPAAWGEPRRIDSGDRVSDAARELLDDVQHQRIVWIAGDHMLGDVHIASDTVRPLWN